MGTPAAIVLLLLLLLTATANAEDDQYSVRNRYRSGPEVVAAGPLIHDHQDDAYELNFVPVSNDEKSYIVEPESELRNLNARLKINSTSDEKKRMDELQVGCEGNPLRKRSEDTAVPLKELLKQWGIDTTTRARRGDIEVVEAPRPGGDVPGGRSKRDVKMGRKLLWARGEDRMWGFAEDDGVQMSEEVDDGRQHVKSPGHHHHRMHYEDEETRRRIDEERRRHWEEQERRRIEDERRRRLEDERRRRVEEDRRRTTSVPERDPYEERRRAEDDRRRTMPMPERDPYEESRRAEEERRRTDGRKTVMPQRDPYEERRRPEEERRRNEGRKTTMPQEDPYEEKRRIEDERRKRIEEERRKMTTVPEQDPYELRRRAEDERRRNDGETYEERLRKWQQMKEEHDRMVRERENHRRHPDTAPEEYRSRSQEELERERKLQDYIRRNTPITVSRNRSQQPSNLYDANSRQVPANLTLPQRRPHEDTRIEEYPRRDERIRENEAVRRAELQRRLDEDRRRKLVEEQSRRMMEERRRNNQKRPDPNEYQRTVPPEETVKTRNRQPPPPRWWERKEAGSSTVTPVDEGEIANRKKGPGSTRGWDVEGNRRRYHEFKKAEDSVTLHPTTDAEERLRRLPVNARIIIRPNGIDNDNNNTAAEATPPPALNLRFGDDIDFPGLGPSKKGPEVPKFPVPPTEQPPAESPASCTWAIVVCCKEPTKRDANRLTRCLEATGCPGANWDRAICSPSKVRAANDVIMRFYLAGQTRRNRPNNVIEF